MKNQGIDDSPSGNLELIAASVTQRTKWNRKTGKRLNKKVYVSRIVYRDNAEKKRESTREFLRKKDAEDHMRLEKGRFKATHGRGLEANKMTFLDLAALYGRQHVKPAEYAGEQKISGLRSLGSALSYLKTLRDCLGVIRLNKITYSTIQSFRDERLRTPVVIERNHKVELTADEKRESGTRAKYKKVLVQEARPRKIASVNRELTMLRHMLTFAVREGWIEKNPFTAGPGLIQVSAEEMRQRVLSRDEEARILSICDQLGRPLLKSIVICLLDTGMRFNELRTLTWDGVDLDNGLINIRAFNTKTTQPKTVAISARLKSELLLQRERQDLEAGLGTEPEERVFGIASNVKASWTTVRRLAGLEDVRLHDLRHTFGTRLNQLGLSQASIARSLGHQQLSTTYRYINADGNLLDSVRTALDGYNSSHSGKTKK